MTTRVFSIVEKIPGWLTKHEGQFLEKAVQSLAYQKGAVVEIGSYCGKSTIWLAQTAGKVFAIDPHKGEISGGKTKPTFTVFIHNLKRAGVETIVTPIIKTSRDAHRNWKKPIKFLFIDGLHDYDHALEDLLLWLPHLEENGIVAMHDAFCGWEGAGKVALRHIVYNPDFEEIGVVGSIIFGIKGSVSLHKRIHILRNQLVIELCNSIYRSLWIPKWIQFILVHKFLRIFLVNRFTLTIWRKSRWGAVGQKKIL